MKLIWIISHDVFRGDDITIVEYTKACVALTNYHTTLHPMRNDEAFVNGNIDNDDG